MAIPSSAIPLSLLAVLGFQQPVEGLAQTQPSSVTTFIKVVFVFVPFVCCCLSFLVKLFFPIKTKRKSDLITEGGLDLLSNYIVSPSRRRLLFINFT